MNRNRGADDARWAQPAAIGLLLVLFALLLSGVQPNAFTADEPAYIAGGYTLLARGREAFPILAQRGYPPLLPALEAALLYASNPGIPLETLTQWPPDFDPFIHAFEPYLTPLPRVKLITRIPTIWLTVVLGALICRWGRDLWDARAGLMALVVLTFDPNLLAHGRLATTDVGVTAIGTAALYTAWRWSRTPAWHWSLTTGVLLGLAMLAKISAPLWGAVIVLVMLAALFRKRGQADEKSIWAQAIIAAGLTFLVFWAGYAFTVGEVWIFPSPVPAPAHWRSTFYLTNYRSEFFALSQRQYGRWWWYFPLTFLLKNPLPLLIGLLAGCVKLLCDWRANTRYLVVFSFPVLYAVIAVTGGMNIGYRHLLPIAPFIYLIIGQTANSQSQITFHVSRFAFQSLRFTFYVLIFWLIVATFSISPHELAYFNELIGGPQNGYRYLADSNLDWGQSADTLAAYAAAHPGVQTDPPAAKLRPAPGRYIVSASWLQGLGIGDPDAYAWFRQREPAEIIDYNLLIYDVPPFDVDWLAQCGAPVTPLDDDAIAQGFGQPARHTGFDCTQAWLYPGGGATSGVYALERGLMQKDKLCWPDFLPCPAAPSDPFIARHLAAARLSFDVARKGESLPFVLYEMPSAIPDLPAATVYAVPAETAPAYVAAFSPWTSPVAFDGPLSYLGARAYRTADAVDIETWWRVEEAPVTRSFSLMAHLISAQGDVIDTADGLGVWPMVLAEGDVVVQRHRFSLPQTDTALWLRTGGYWLDTLERWPVVDGEARRDAVLLEQIVLGDAK